MRFWRVGKEPSARITAFLRLVVRAIFLDEAVFRDELAICARLVGCMMLLED